MLLLIWLFLYKIFSNYRYEYFSIIIKNILENLYLDFIFINFI